jgi:hypothetical protein
MFALNPPAVPVVLFDRVAPLASTICPAPLVPTIVLLSGMAAPFNPVAAAALVAVAANAVPLVERHVKAPVTLTEQSLLIVTGAKAVAPVFITGICPAVPSAIPVPFAAQAHAEPFHASTCVALQVLIRDRFNVPESPPPMRPVPAPVVAPVSVPLPDPLPLRFPALTFLVSGTWLCTTRNE